MGWATVVSTTSGIGAGICRGQRHLGRHDVGELRHRNAGDGDEPGQRDDDGDDESQPRPVDEDGRDHGLSPRYPARERGFDRLAGPHLLHPVDDDLFALLQAVFDDDIQPRRVPS